MALAEQQYKVLSIQLPSLPNRLLSSNDRIDRCSKQSMWDDDLKNINIFVCTHQVFLNALIHGSVQMDKIALLIFDEAHYCIRGHPVNDVMQKSNHAKKLTTSPVKRKKGEGSQ